MSDNELGVFGLTEGSVSYDGIPWSVLVLVVSVTHPASGSSTMSRGEQDEVLRLGEEFGLEGWMRRHNIFTLADCGYARRAALATEHFTGATHSPVCAGG